MPIEETLEALNDVVRAGKALHIGASSMYAWQFAKALALSEKHGWARFQTMQNYVNLLYREEEREMLPLCKAEGIGVIPWSPLARGRLTRDWDTSTARTETDGFGKTLYAKTAEADRKVVEAVAAVAARLGRPRAQVALAWVLQKPEVSAPIVGATKARAARRRRRRAVAPALARRHRRARSAVRAARGDRPHLTRGLAPRPFSLASGPGAGSESVTRCRGTDHSARRRCFPKLTLPTVLDVGAGESLRTSLHFLICKESHEPEAHPLPLDPRRRPGGHRQRRARRRPVRQSDPRRSQGQRPPGARPRPAQAGRRSRASRSRPPPAARRSRTARCATRRSWHAPTASSSPPAKARRSSRTAARRWRAPTSRKPRAWRA